MGDIERILVPLDGSKLFKTALPMAISLAKQYNT
jgi:nucleotide-binding universal stress UspA family protein